MRVLVHFRKNGFLRGSQNGVFTAGAKKFIAGRFLDYKIVYSKYVISQVQELQAILHKIHAKGMSLSESFQVACIIKNYHRYGRTLRIT